VADQHRIAQFQGIDEIQHVTPQGGQLPAARRPFLAEPGRRKPAQGRRHHAQPRGGKRTRHGPPANRAVRPAVQQDRRALALGIPLQVGDFQPVGRHEEKVHEASLAKVAQRRA